MKVILVNVEVGREVAIKWKRASYTKLSAYCLQILREIRCSGKKLLINPTTCEKEHTSVFTQMNHIVLGANRPSPLGLWSIYLKIAFRGQKAAMLKQKEPTLKNVGLNETRVPYFLLHSSRNTFLLFWWAARTLLKDFWQIDLLPSAFYLVPLFCNFIVGVACCAWREVLNA